jgi:hypothetical protein
MTECALSIWRKGEDDLCRTITPVPIGGSPEGTPVWTSPICMPSPSRARGQVDPDHERAPSVHDYLDHENPLGPTTPEPFAPEALYELKIDTDGRCRRRYRVPGSLLFVQSRRAEGDATPSTGQCIAWFGRE